MIVIAPFAGRVVAAADVPDPVFAEGIVGPGPAVEPADTVVDVRAPATGTVTALKPHAVIITPLGAPAKVGVLVHLGIDTVRLAGQGASVHVALGDEVAAGDALITWDTGAAKAAGLSLVCPLVGIGISPDRWTDVAVPGAGVAAGDPMAQITPEAPDVW